MPASLAPMPGAAEPGQNAIASESPRSRAVRLALALAGLVLFVLVLRSVGWGEVSANLARVGPHEFYEAIGCRVVKDQRVYEYPL